MKLYKILFIAAIAIGFMACNADDQPEVLQHETDTYASITVKFPGTVGTRAGLPGDYNENGTWTGRDKLERVDVFLVNLDRATINHSTFTDGTWTQIDGSGVLHPNLVMEATSGDLVQAYVVINASPDIVTELNGVTVAADFAGAFGSAYEQIASQVARYNEAEAPETTGTETIMMTNDEDKYNLRVAAGISKGVAASGTSNNILVNVERVVSRALLTVTPESTEGEGWPVGAISGATDIGPIAYVTEVNYSVGQSNKNFYLMKQSDYSVPAPVYGYIPLDTDWASTNSILDYTEVDELTDFKPVYQLDYTTTTTDITEALKNEATSKFVLPVNHLVKQTDLNVARAAYKKGNTTYFEIQAKFIPTEVITDSEGTTTTPTEAATVYWGEIDKKFYSTYELATVGQNATTFTNGIMKYVLWLNPNELESTPDDPNPKVSPTVRNQIYHAHISSFDRMGLPVNPLNPTDEINSTDPINPIKPGDPLKTDQTYLSVKVKVLDWTIHSYSYKLTDPGTMY